MHALQSYVTLFQGLAKKLSRSTLFNTKPSFNSSSAPMPSSPSISQIHKDKVHLQEMYVLPTGSLW
ncbi:hypothetical protein LguiA_020270 [Lonicera macranthoides]